MQVRITSNADYARRKTRRSESGSSSEASRPVSSGRDSFSEILEEVLPSDGATTGDLHQLWQDLPGAERALLDHPSEENLQRYRRIVFDIARETLRKNTRVQKVRRRNRNGDVIELTIVEFVDRRLQEMAKLMHAPGNSAFRMLKTVEEIRGALVDVRE